MNPLRVRASGYRSYERIDLDLPQGLAAIVGPNGAGKSSLLEIIPLALFGPRSGRTLAPYLSEDGEETTVSVELVFEHAGETYRVRRSYSASGRGKSTLDFESAWPFGEWKPLTRETAAATQTEIERVLGLTADTFLASAYLGQGEGANFTSADPRARKQILSEILGLGIYTQLAELAKRDRKAAETALAELEGELHAARETVEGLDAALAAHQDASARGLAAERTLAEAEQRLADVTERYQAAKETAALAKAAQDLLAAKQAAVDENERRQREIIARLESIDAELQEQPRLAEQAAQVPALEQRWTEHSATVAEHRRVTVERSRLLAEKQDADAALLAAQARLTAVDAAEHVTCDACGQTVGDTATLRATLERATSEASIRVVDVTEKLAALTVAPAPEPIGNLEHDLRTARAAASRLATVKAQEALAMNLRDDLLGLSTVHPVLVDQRDQAQTAANQHTTIDLAALVSEGGTARLAVDIARAALDQARADKARLEERLATIRQAETKIRDAQGAVAYHQADLDLLHQLERAFGPNGIPLLVLENAAIPYLETEATRILGELGTSYRVELRTQAANKTSDTIRDTLDVLVVTEAGERPFETFSGGERSRLNIALRIALARLLAHRRGAESRVLCIDELEYLDEPGQAALLDVLRGLQGDFDKLILVSHVPGLRDAFDTTIEVVKENGRSRIVGTPGAEAVAA